MVVNYCELNSLGFLAGRGERGPSLGTGFPPSGTNANVPAEPPVHLPLHLLRLVFPRPAFPVDVLGHFPVSLHDPLLVLLLVQMSRRRGL